MSRNLVNSITNSSERLDRVATVIRFDSNKTVSKNVYNSVGLTKAVNIIQALSIDPKRTITAALELGISVLYDLGVTLGIIDKKGRVDPCRVQFMYKIPVYDANGNQSKDIAIDGDPILEHPLMTVKGHSKCRISVRDAVRLDSLKLIFGLRRDQDIISHICLTTASILDVEHNDRLYVDPRRKLAITKTEIDYLSGGDDARSR